jgi:hypothetical protein
MRWVGTTIVVMGLAIALYAGAMRWELELLRQAPQAEELEPAASLDPQGVLHWLIETVASSDSGGLPNPSQLMFRVSAVIYVALAVGLLVAGCGGVMVFASTESKPSG